MRCLPPGERFRRGARRRSERRWSLYGSYRTRLLEEDLLLAVVDRYDPVFEEAVADIQSIVSFSSRALGQEDDPRTLDPEKADLHVVKLSHTVLERASSAGPLADRSLGPLLVQPQLLGGFMSQGEQPVITGVELRVELSSVDPGPDLWAAMYPGQPLQDAIPEAERDQQALRGWRLFLIRRGDGAAREEGQGTVRR